MSKFASYLRRLPDLSGVRLNGILLGAAAVLLLGAATVSGHSLVAHLRVDRLIEATRKPAAEAENPPEDKDAAQEGAISEPDARDAITSQTLAADSGSTLTTTTLMARTAAEATTGTTMTLTASPPTSGSLSGAMPTSQTLVVQEGTTQTLTEDRSSSPAAPGMMVAAGPGATEAPVEPGTLPEKFRQLITEKPLFGAAPQPEPNLEGVLGRFAFINGQWIEAGQQMGDVKVIAINGGKVSIEFKGQPRELTLWQNLPGVQ